MVQQRNKNGGIASLAGIEYNTLPSGIHDIKQDRIYFTTSQGSFGLAICGRAVSSDTAQRGAIIKAVGLTCNAFDELPYFIDALQSFIKYVVAISTSSVVNYL